MSYSNLDVASRPRSKTVSRPAKEDWRARSAATRAARSQRSILEATRELVDRVGTQSVTIAQIARGAGVGEATVYNAFGSRSRLITCAVLGPKISLLENTARRDAEKLPAREAAERYLVRVARVFMANREVSAGFFEALSTTADPTKSLDPEAIFLMPAPLRHIFECGQASGQVRSDLDPDETADAISLVLLYRVVRYRQSPTLCLRGLRPFLDGVFTV